MNQSNALYQTSAIKQLEELAMSHDHVSSETLMERAGEAAFQCLRQHWSPSNHIAIFCGKGNNGGDGFVLARLAKHAGYAVTVYAMADKEQLKGAAMNAAAACERANVRITRFSTANISADVVVDALLGTGIRGELQEDYLKAIGAINALKVPVLSIDVPSGLDANTGAVLNDAVHATITITFIGLKSGLFTGDGPTYAGNVHCDDLQISKEIIAQVSPQATLITSGEVLQALPRRNKDSQKGDFGHVLIIGGDYGMAGAARMAGEAAARMGAGLTTIATHAAHVTVISAERPELMCHAVETEQDLQPLLQKATVIAIGPGLGKSDWSQQLLQAALKSKLPKVVDADALNLLAELNIKHNNRVLTPHPGEAARLLNVSTSDIQKDRFAAVKNLQQRYGGVCVLKGSGTLVQGSGIPGVCSAGNPGMASGGMGDVLTGVIAGLLAQKIELEKAARLGVYIHSHAADRAALQGGERGLLALDLMPFLHRLANPS